LIASIDPGSKPIREHYRRRGAELSCGMRNVFSRWSEPAYSVMRVVIGLLYLLHGLQKVFGAFGGHRMAMTSQLGVAGVIETVAGTLIVVGLFTSAAAFVAGGEMAFAYFIAHAPRAPLPIQNGGEPAVAFCFVFLYLATCGDGRWSLASLLRRRRVLG
jgi:putative oxidoreductase